MRRGFTLLESLMASGILLGVVVSVTGAIAAGQQHAYEAHQRIAGSLAAEELIGRLVIEDYDNLLSWSGHTESIGAMTDLKGDPMPGSMAMVGRNVTVTPVLATVGDLGVRVRGANVSVRAFNREGRTLADLSRFIPEPS